MILLFSIMLQSCTPNFDLPPEGYLQKQPKQAEEPPLKKQLLKAEAQHKKAPPDITIHSNKVSNPSLPASTPTPAPVPFQFAQPHSNPTHKSVTHPAAIQPKTSSQQSAVKQRPTRPITTLQPRTTQPQPAPGSTAPNLAIVPKQKTPVSKAAALPASVQAKTQQSTQEQLGHTNLPERSPKSASNSPKDTQLVATVGKLAECLFTTSGGEQVCFELVDDNLQARVTNRFFPGYSETLPVIYQGHEALNQALTLLQRRVVMPQYGLHVLQTQYPPYAPKVLLIGKKPGIKGGGASSSNLRIERDPYPYFVQANFNDEDSQGREIQSGIEGCNWRVRLFPDYDRNEHTYYWRAEVNYGNLNDSYNWKTEHVWVKAREPLSLSPNDLRGNWHINYSYEGNEVTDINSVR